MDARVGRATSAAPGGAGGPEGRELHELHDELETRVPVTIEVGQIQAMTAAEIFVSYQRADRDAAALISDLEAVYNPDRLFVDVHDVRAGTSFPAAIADAIRACTVVLATIGAGWPSGPRGEGDADNWIVRELVYAQQYQRQVLPVLVGGAQMPAPLSLPPPVQYVAYLNALPSPGSPREALMGQVIATLASMGVAPRPQPALAGTSNRASVASWVDFRSEQVIMSDLVKRAQAAGGQLEARESSYAKLLFGSRSSKWTRGVWLTKPDDLPLGLQLAVRPGPGVTLVEGRCDERWGDGMFPTQKYEQAFARVWTALGAR